MRERVELKENWRIKQGFGKEGTWISVGNFPAQIQDILFEHQMLPEKFLAGWCEDALFIGKNDWVYECRFEACPERKSRLVMEGLDTFVSIWLNGKLLGEHTDFYLPGEFETTGLLKKKNILKLCFQSPLKYLEKAHWEEKWTPAVLRCKAVRKPIHDFPPEKEESGSNYQGAVPWFTPVGVYGPVWLEYEEQERITDTWVQAEVKDDGREGMIWLGLRGTGEPDEVLAELVSEEGTVVLNQSFSTILEEAEWNMNGCFRVNAPKLWYPRGYGEQPLYRIRITLKKAGVVQDVVEKTAAFRDIQMTALFSYRINEKKVRLFGGSLDPMQGYTHCYQPKRAERLFTMVENANMNTLRIWGEGIPLPDAFYEACDKRGILVWQEFFLGHGAYPDSEEIRRACVLEAEHLIRRLRHHPCLLLWCGGNETIMGAQFQHQPPFGAEIVLEDLKKVVQRLDPDRYYHPNSPYGGEWANDPRTGDFHTYDCVWEYPYKDYPNFISEHIRTAPPVKHSLEKMIPGPLWEKGFTGDIHKWGDPILPENWLIRTHKGANMPRKTGEYWEFPETDTPEGLIYRFGAAYGQEIKRYATQVRIGSREPAPFEKRSKGYFACKLVDTWPKIYCAPIDYFQEAYLPYYAMKRALSPVVVCFQKEESIRLWCVNDSGSDFTGEVVFGIWNLLTEKIEEVRSVNVQTAQGEASLLYDLAKFQFFSKDDVLFAVLHGKDGETVYTDIDFVDVRRHLVFGDAGLSAYVEQDEIVLCAQHFAECVEILGKQGENCFGWLFSDNYFPMMPGEIRRIKILGNKTYGTIQIQTAGQAEKKQRSELILEWKKG